jgi:4-alpha-glucanotransferase
LASVANQAIFPLQDLLGLGSEAMMNKPGTSEGNWAWRFEPGVLTDEIGDRLKFWTETYGRLPMD